MSKVIQCSICEEPIEETFSNNADPFDGRCCDDCEWKYVIPARRGTVLITSRKKLYAVRNGVRIAKWYYKKGWLSLEPGVTVHSISENGRAGIVVSYDPTGASKH
jgi:hypothetical protein